MSSGARLLKEWLQRGQWGSAQFAKELDISAVYLWQLLNGVRHPSITTAANIEELTGIPARSWKPSRVDSTETPTNPVQSKRRVAKG